MHRPLKLPSGLQFASPLLLSCLLLVSVSLLMSSASLPVQAQSQEGGRGNLTVWGLGEVVTDANVTEVQISVEVRSEQAAAASASSSPSSSSAPLIAVAPDQGEWTHTVQAATMATTPMAASASYPESSSAPRDVASSSSSSSSSGSGSSSSSSGSDSSSSIKTAADVQREVSKLSEQLVTYLKAQKDIQKLKTVSVSLRPLERWKEGQMYNYGWIGLHSLSFEVHADQAGKYIDEAVRHGASRIDSVTMKPSDKDSEIARHKAIQLAARNAMSEASMLMEALGQSRDSFSILEMDIEPTNVVIPFRNFDMAAPMAAIAEDAGKSAAYMPIVGGQHKVSARVRFRLSFDQSKVRQEQ